MRAPFPLSTEETHDPEELEALYLAYRRRQARGLVSLMPREAVRPLYRAAIHALGSADSGDPLQILVEYCERILPLPPFDVWCADLARHPDGHLGDWDEAADAPTASRPVSLAVRSVRCLGQLWRVRLRAFRDQDVWRAFITFDGAALSDTHQTAVVFREATPGDLRARFLEFESPALEGFLRSCLP